MSRKARLSEILGGAGTAEKAQRRKLSFDDLGDLLGDSLPEIPFNAVGKFRLTNALKGRFGEGFRNIPGVKDIISDFEERRSFEDRISQLKAIKYSPKKKD